MIADHDQPWQGMSNWLKRFDWWLILLLLLLMLGSLLILYSSNNDAHILWRQMLHFAMAWSVFLFIMMVPSVLIRKLTPFLYVITIVLLILVLFFGSSAGGAQRWLDLKFLRVQPSELAKLSVPMMVAWYASRQAQLPRSQDIFAIALFIIFPVWFIFLQPDLGTAILVTASGIIALFLAGLSWWFLGILITLTAVILPVFWFWGIKDYQRQRILTLFNPEADPFGAGYHIIQSKIAIGSGGIFGKGYMSGTQSQLAFLPESSTDFIFAVLAEEHGLIGVTILLTIYLLIILRGLYLSTRLTDRFACILSGSVFLTFFINVFVNIGMVSGFLPVVGLPLALISYGGSSILSLMVAFALAMNVHAGFMSDKEQEQL